MGYPVILFPHYPHFLSVQSVLVCHCLDIFVWQLNSECCFIKIFRVLILSVSSSPQSAYSVCVEDWFYSCYSAASSLEALRYCYRYCLLVSASCFPCDWNIPRYVYLYISYKALCQFNWLSPNHVPGCIISPQNINPIDLTILAVQGINIERNITEIYCYSLARVQSSSHTLIHGVDWFSQYLICWCHMNTEI